VQIQSDRHCLHTSAQLSTGLMFFLSPDQQCYNVAYDGVLTSILLVIVKKQKSYSSIECPH